MTMAENAAIDALADDAVLRIVRHRTQEIRDEVPDGERQAIRSADEAAQAVAALLDAHGAAQVARLDEIDNRQAAEQGRQLVRLLRQDPELRPRVDALVAHPPADTQKAAIEMAAASAVILGALVSWLQTRLEIDVDRKNGKTSFRFRLRKQAAGSDLIKDVIDPVKRIVLGG